MATGCVTSWPPSKAGVIIGPQQPGGVPVIRVPPSASGPSIGWLGPMMPLGVMVDAQAIDGRVEIGFRQKRCH